MIPISSSDEYSWKRSSELLVEVARHGEESGHEVPSLIVAAKDALDPHPMSLPRVRILSAAEWDLNIPETVAGRRRKQFRWHVNHSLLLMSGFASHSHRKNKSHYTDA
ncbi:hypothetical protein H0E87_004108 [Populus deltoides]|uniref:Uncharacterized protein n=1 Tax=Populus deltoides TaxID=3696 RepID=A0A8T2ZDU9_POPDE|nr:hypothetical protein H0E87_004108 [Populus deltoides]